MAPWRVAVGMVTTFAFVSLTFGLIRAPDLATYGEILNALFTGAPGRAPFVDRTILFIALAIMIIVEALSRFTQPPQRVSPWLIYAAIATLFVITILFGFDQARSFVYFRF